MLTQNSPAHKAGNTKGNSWIVLQKPQGPLRIHDETAFQYYQNIKYISVGAVFYFNNRDSWPYWSRFLLYFLKIGANSAKINVYV